MALLNIGDLAPNFQTTDDSGTSYSLNALKGKIFILYFYPKDNTPGCTIEAKDFSRILPEIKALGGEVFAVSKDNLKSHKKFKDECELSIPLLLDEAGKICESYGVMREKSMFGKKYLGISRDTFIVDKAGKIAYIWRNVSANGHAKEVLEKLKTLV